MSLKKLKMFKFFPYLPFLDWTLEIHSHYTLYSILFYSLFSILYIYIYISSFLFKNFSFSFILFVTDPWIQIFIVQLVKLLELREANHIEFCRIKSVLDEILQMHRNSDLNKILKLLMDPTWVATGLKIDFDTLVSDNMWF